MPGEEHEKGAKQRRLDRYFIAAVIMIAILNTPSWLPAVFQRIYPEAPVTNSIAIYYDITVPLGMSTGVGVVRNQPAGFLVNDTWPGLNALNKDLNGVVPDSKKMIAIEVNRTVTLGSNVAVVPYIISGGQRIIPSTSIAYLVFLVDPQGIVRFSYPSGDIPISFVYRYPDLSNDMLDGMTRGTVAFTHEIPVELTSLGVWTVVVLSIDYSRGVPSYSLRGSAKGNFEVVRPKPLPESPSILELINTFMLTWVGPTFMVWGLLNVSEVRQAARLLVRNIRFIVGTAIMVLFFILAYLT